MSLNTLAALTLMSLLCWSCAESAEPEKPASPGKSETLPATSEPGRAAERRSADVTTLTAIGNPVFAGADPHAVVIGNRVWVYPTWGGRRFFAFSTTDLRRWERQGPVLDFKDIPWIQDDGAPWHGAWAPALAEKGGKFYFYYSVGPQNPTPSRIGVAVSDSPAGPFRDSGKPLLTGGNGFEAIDPMVFTDPKSGKSFLYAGGSAGAKLRVFEMKPDMVSFRREVEVKTPPEFTEGVFVHERKGTYYLTYSHGGWQDASYSVHYATSDTPVGPWLYRGKILASDARHKGPGHHSIFQVPGRDEWFIVYHRWNDQNDNGPYRGSRQVAIQKLAYYPDGRIRPVEMTDTLPALPALPVTSLSGKSAPSSHQP